ncbi:hypothetical protein HHK36_032668 [Tetracentron sinense]|uniref:Uncharacterized protein n=1 Tax=Tetracentron sinense TaxID=13715 RepID=A0A835CXD6_TETSI|nr:hypothetical protein HHK36_032668 [Tetracentron sinense]
MASIVNDADDIRSKGVAWVGNSSISGIESSSGTLLDSEIPKQGDKGSILHGVPDFAEVYTFIGSVFDPDTKGHVQKLKQMDPINFETVSILLLFSSFMIYNTRKSHLVSQ